MKFRNLLFSFIIIFLFVGCTVDNSLSNSKDTFGIYLTKAEIKPDLLEAASYIEPLTPPVISMDDIISYTWSTHEIELTETGRKKIDNLSVPVQGRSFVVCVNNSPRYAGAFWTPISSISFSGITITSMKPTPEKIKISLGYPSDIYASKPDPRANSDIEKVLRNAGKIR